MCDSIVHVYRYTVILSYTVTFQRLDQSCSTFYTEDQGFTPCSRVLSVYFCSFVFSSNQPQSMLLSNRAGTIGLGCYKILFFFPQVNKLHCFFKSLKKTWRYSWEKQEVQLVSFLFLSTDSVSFFSFFDGEISTQHPHSEPLRAGMYPLDPALHSFLAKINFEIL